MEPWHYALLVVAGMCASGINSVVGSGTLVTYPALLLCGLSPLSANLTNTVGLVAGGLSGTWGYRRELAAVWTLIRSLAIPSFFGAVTGLTALWLAPESVFEAVVPWLVIFALLIFVLASRKKPGREGKAAQRSSWRRYAAYPAMFGAGCYGAYFGGAQGIIVITILVALAGLPTQHANAGKNALVTLANSLAAVGAIVLMPGQINWLAALCVAIGSGAGGFLGAKLARRLPPHVLRGVVVAVGLLAAVLVLMR